MKYEEHSLTEIANIIDDGLVLVVTATDIETSATHEKLNPIKGYNGIIQVFHEANTYYIGKFGKYHIAHVQSNMGAVARDSSIMTITSAITNIKPKFVLMVGIAFGIDNVKQRIGDVLISEGIIPYDNKRVGKETIYRGQIAPSSKVLLDRFKAVKTWEFFLPDTTKAVKIPTQILSGEELIDNIERRDEIVKHFPTSKGGEMEGAGLFAACDGKVDWILVKGICDFADGNKSDDKKENQTLAINSALSLCNELFNSNHAFRSLGLAPVSEKETHICKVKHEDADKVLFEVYLEENEEYYLPRKADKTFSNILGQYCIWIHGISGCGKTNLISRNLILNKIEYIQISLASCIGLEVIDLFKEMLYDLENKLNHFQHSKDNQNFSIVSRNILSILEDKCKDTNTIIFIEEIPISDSKYYEQFVTHFFSLLISKKLKHGLNNVKFVLSSIKNPTIHIQQHQLKIHQQVKFIELDNWVMEDIVKLIRLISESLNIDLSDDFTNKLIKTSNRSPRFIKKFFRNILACCVSTSDDYIAILLETERELKQYYND